MQNEIWRPVTTYEGFYEVSNLGHVKSIHYRNSRIMGTSLRNGYPRVKLTTRDGVHRHHTIHRLVALAFIPNPENKPQVDHIDGNKLNYAAENLRWCTQFENIRFSIQLRALEKAMALVRSNDLDQDENSRLIKSVAIKRLGSQPIIHDRPPIERRNKSSKFESAKKLNLKKISKKNSYGL